MNTAGFVDLRDTLMGGSSGAVHTVELMVDQEVREAFLGHPIRSMEEEVRFWSQAGYDYMPVVISAFGFMGAAAESGFTQETAFAYSRYSELPQRRQWAREGRGIVTSWQDFRALRWPDPQAVDLGVLHEARRHLPPGMGLVGVVPRIFVAVWMLMGFEHFSLCILDQPALVEALFAQVGETQLRISSRLVQEAGVDALWLGDDIAHGQGSMVSPALLRSLLFPWYRQIGDLCRKAGIPLIYHSDGNVYEVIPDLLDCGINALHPLEPGAMDALKIKKDFGSSLCLLGNIEVDTLARGSAAEVERLTLSRLESLWSSGGYCPGSSNSVTNYMPLENYRAMLRAIRHFDAANGRRGERDA